jgi:hypothetical protein
MIVIRHFMLVILYQYTALINAAGLPSITMPFFDVMNDMKVEWVAKEYFYNGYPMTIQRFTSSKLSKDILTYYQNKWRSSGHGHQNYSLVGKEFNIGYEEDGYSYTVQAEDTSYGSRGTLVVTENKQYELGPLAVPVHTDNKIISRMHSVDNSVLSETIILNSLKSISHNKHWYHALLVKDGWILQSDNSNSTENVLMYQKLNQYCQITYAGKNDYPGHKVVVMIHWIRGKA